MAEFNPWSGDRSKTCPAFEPCPISSHASDSIIGLRRSVRAGSKERCGNTGGLEQVAANNPDTTTEIVRIARGEFAHYAENDKTFNGLMVCDLSDVQG